MKLKKIASLMLAGIMAVSMLAGCNGNTINDDPAQSEEPSAPAGYSALVQEGLSNTATKKVSLNDSTELNNALKAAMEYASNSNIAYWYDNVKFPVTVQVIDDSAQTFAREMVSGVKSLIADMNAENEIETLVKAKGFADCLCFLQSDRADLTVMTSGEALTAAQVAQIRDIVLSKTSVTAQNITVVEVK